MYEIWPYKASIISYPFVYNRIYSSSNSSCSKVYLNLNIRISGPFGHPFLLMKSISFSQCLTSVYVAWSWFGDRTILLAFNTWHITTMKVVFGSSGRILVIFLLMRSPTSVAGHMLPYLPVFLNSRTSLAHFLKNISTHCRIIDSVLSKLSNGTRSRMSPQNLQPLSPSARVHL